MIQNRRRLRRRVSVMGVAVAALSLLLPVSAAQADSRLPDRRHPNVIPHDYYISNDYPAAWVTPSTQAAGTWTNGTRFDLRYRGRTAETDFANAYRLLRYDAIPAAWQTGCPSATTIACTRTTASTTSGSTHGTVHIFDADIVLQDSSSFPYTVTDPALCTPTVPAVAYDVRTVVLHELGHFGGLGHDPNRPPIMFAGYKHCQWNLDNQDTFSANNNYPGH